MKKCARCNIAVSFNQFLSDKRTKDGYGSWCRNCRNEYKRSPRQLKLARKAKKTSRDKNYERYRKLEKTRELRNKFNMTLDDLSRMKAEQNSSCAICNKHESELKKSLCIDHCHKTNKVRALLCNTCNVGLGHFLDSEELLIKAFEYLKRHRS
jgi:hypothetical protein